MLAGLEQFDRVVNTWFEDVASAAQEAAAGMAEVALTYILEESPQFSGDFVAGWEASFSTPSLIWRPPQAGGAGLIKKGLTEPREKGDPDSIDYALSKAAPRLSAAGRQLLGTPIFLSNSASHDEPYAWKIERGEIEFRPENPNASRVVERGAEFVYRRFSTIDRSKLAVLRSVGV